MPLLGQSRGEVKASNNIGYLTSPIEGAIGSRSRKFRSPKLEEILKYYEDRAYDHLKDWHEAAKESTYVPVRKRKPFVRLNLPKMIATRLAAKLCGKDVWPLLSLAEESETEYYFKLIIKSSMLQSRMIPAARHMIVTGSVFVRFYIAGAKFKLEHYNANYCYPEFNEEGDLIYCRVQYVFTDHDDLDKDGNPKKKWYRADFGPIADILFDNPEYKPDAEPEFIPVSEVRHGLGFVQGEWLKIGEDDRATPDGMSLVEDTLPFLDSLNYSLSQSQHATDYNTDPQLVLRGMDEDEIQNLVRSNEKAWNLGREGEGSFLESSLNGVATSMEIREKNRKFIQDLTRVIMMDPEKMSGVAQSGKALELLHGPMVELINELRPQFEVYLTSLVIKMSIANLVALRSGGVAPVNVPDGYAPQSFDIGWIWPPVFPMTVQDLRDRVSWVVSAANNNVISRRTAVATLAKDFSIEDIEAELQEIVNQPQINPFGMF